MSVENSEPRDRGKAREPDDDQSEAWSRANDPEQGDNNGRNGLQPGPHRVSSLPLRPTGPEEVPAVRRRLGRPSAQDGDLLPLDEAEVDDGAEPGALEGVDEALLVDLDVLGEAVLLGPRRQQHLEELAVLDGHGHVEVGHVVERVAAVVDLEIHVEGLGEVRGLHEGRDAALHGHVAAEIVRGLVNEPWREGGEPARRVLGGQDRDGQVLLELDVAQQVVVGERVLVPVKAQLLDDLAHAEGLRVLVGPGRVEHDGEAVAHRAPDGATDLGIDDGIGGRVDLVGRPAFGLEARRFLRVRLLARQDGGAGMGGRALAVRAEQAVYGQPRHLARDVPESHVHGPDGAIGGLAVLVPHRPVQALALERVLVEHDGLQVLDERLPVHVRATHGGAEEGVALDALVGLDGHEAELALAAELPRVPAVRGGRNVVPAEQREMDVGDLHGGGRLPQVLLRRPLTLPSPRGGGEGSKMNESVRIANPSLLWGEGRVRGEARIYYAPISTARMDSMRISSVRRALYAENSGVVLTV